MTDATFTALADDFVAQGLAVWGTMMGHACLRAEGTMFACAGRRGDTVVVKLTADRVQEEIEADRGVPFAPGGHPFKQWLEITDPSATYARERLFEALEFAVGGV